MFPHGSFCFPWLLSATLGMQAILLCGCGSSATEVAPSDQLQSKPDTAKKKQTVRRDRTTIEEDGWYRYQSTDGVYEIAFPGIPRHFFGDGRHHFECGERDGLLFRISVRTDPFLRLVEDRQKLLDEQAREAAKLPQYRSLSQKSISLDDHPGRQLDFAVGDTELRDRIQIYVVGQYSFILFVGGRQEGFTEAEMQRFFDSFTVRLPESERNRE